MFGIALRNRAFKVKKFIFKLFPKEHFGLFYGVKVKKNIFEMFYQTS
jgi:hypothetical protein